MAQKQYIFEKFREINSKYKKSILLEAQLLCNQLDVTDSRTHVMISFVDHISVDCRSIWMYPVRFYHLEFYKQAFSDGCRSGNAQYRCPGRMQFQWFQRALVYSLLYLYYRNNPIIFRQIFGGIQYLRLHQSKKRCLVRALQDSIPSQELEFEEETKN